MTYQVNETLLKVENLSMVYDKPILKNVNFEIKNISRPNMYQGQVATILAKSGMGKSQLLRCLAALQHPTEGTVKVFDSKGEKGALKPVKEGDMGVVFQNYVLYEDLTILQNCQIALKFREVKVPNPLEMIQQYAEYFELSHHLKKYPKQLSGGQKQMVALASVLAMLPEYLVLDEPTSMLDPISRRNLIAQLQVLNKEEGVTVIFISHNPEDLIQADRLIVLEQGSVYMDGTPRDVFLSEEIRNLELGRPAVYQLIGELEASGLTVPSNVKSIDELVGYICLRL